MKIKSIELFINPPFIPKFIVNENNEKIWRDPSNKPDSSPSLINSNKEFILSIPIELPDLYWIGMRGNGEFEIFELAKESQWRANESEKCVFIAQEMAIRDPIGSANILLSAANLVGLNIPTLVQSLETKRIAGETLEQVFIRIKKN